MMVLSTTELVSVEYSCTTKRFLIFGTVAYEFSVMRDGSLIGVSVRGDLPVRFRLCLDQIFGLIKLYIFTTTDFE